MNTYKEDLYNKIKQFHTEIMNSSCDCAFSGKIVDMTNMATYYKNHVMSEPPENYEEETLERHLNSFETYLEEVQLEVDRVNGHFELCRE